MEYLKANAIATTSQNYYINAIEDESGNISYEQYSEEEYEEIANTLSVTSFPKDNVAQNSWLRLTFEASKLSNGKYQFFMFYSWKTKPLVTLYDTVGLSYSINLIKK